MTSFCNSPWFLFFLILQAEDERNYHVFYEMLVGLTAEQKKKYGLMTAPKYYYLNQVIITATQIIPNAV